MAIANKSQHVDPIIIESDKNRSCESLGMYDSNMERIYCRVENDYNFSAWYVNMIGPLA